MAVTHPKETTARTSVVGAKIREIALQDRAVMEKVSHERSAPTLSSCSLVVPSLALPVLLTHLLLLVPPRSRTPLVQASQAFVSFVRAYSEHHCAYVFPFKKLPWLQLFDAFGLLKVGVGYLRDGSMVRFVFSSLAWVQVPAMPELRRLRFPSFRPLPPGVHVSEIPYKDPVREAARQADIQSVLGRNWHVAHALSPSFPREPLLLRSGALEQRRQSIRKEVLQRRKAARKAAKVPP